MDISSTIIILKINCIHLLQNFHLLWKKKKKSILPTNQKEVYNIGNNLFKYDDAEHLCKAFGGELATYEQLEKAFEKGADWCNYGWSQDQMALYPTQKSTWENLQKGPKMHRKDCGVPGINGGYFEDKNMRFGVNCYGVKPKEKPGTIYKTVYKQYDAKTEKFKKLKDDLIVLPFDSNSWNRDN